MAVATLTSKGQITIPKEIRDSLDLRAGDKIEFNLEGGRLMALKRKTTRIEDVAGILSKYVTKTYSIKEMDEAVAEIFRQKYNK